MILLGAHEPMKIAYLQCPTGIAGDMCLGALVDAGVPVDYLITQLGRLGIAQEYRLWAESVQRNGLRATKFHVDLVFESGEIVSPDIFSTFDRETHHQPSSPSPTSHPTPEFGASLVESEAGRSPSHSPRPNASSIDS